MAEESKKVVPMTGLSPIRALYSMFNRMGLGRLLGGNLGGKRDYNKLFGWDEVLTPENMRYMYNRGGIAKRLVDSYPDAIWSGPPAVYVQEEASWFTQFETVTKDLNLWSVLHRLDKLCRLGEYAVLLIGTNKGALTDSLKPNSTITFLQPYGQANATIRQWDTNPNSPTFGRPLQYQITPQTGGGISGTSTGLGSSIAGPTMGSFLVHASRVVHVVRGNLENEVYGQPVMAPVWDYLTDLRKVVGSSSESYWINANRGLQANIDKDMAVGAEDAAALAEEIDDFYNGFTRFIKTKGVDMKALDNNVSDPKGPFDVLVTLIAGTSGTPKRILLGSEAGQLASSEDRGNWAERIEEERKLQTNPYILNPILAKFLQMGVLAAPTAGEIKVLWPDAYHMSPLERGQTQAQSARSIANIIKMLESENKIASTLLSREECRALIGLSTDNRILSIDPNI